MTKKEVVSAKGIGVKKTKVHEQEDLGKRIGTAVTGQSQIIERFIGKIG